MPIPLIARLSAAVRLSEPEVEALQNLAAHPFVVEPGTVLLQEGWSNGADQGRGILLLNGWAVRSRTLANGRRQIIRFLIAGDICDPAFFVPREAVHSVETLTQATVATFETEALLDLFRRWPRIAAGFWWLAGEEQAILQDKIASLGQRNAFERAVDLIWELWRRHEQAGQTVDHTFPFPLTLDVFGSALGLSLIYTHRTLRRLKEEGLIETHNRMLVIRDPDRIRALAQGSGAGVVFPGPSEPLLNILGRPRAGRGSLGQKV